LAETASQGFLSLRRSEQFGVVDGPVHRTLDSSVVVVTSVDTLSDAAPRAVLQPSGPDGKIPLNAPFEGSGSDSVALRGL
jgi:hypothetical protein